MSDFAISVRNLTKTYKLYRQPVDRLKEALHPLKKSYHKDFNALDNVSFDIKRGETVGIIGRNGSGKSTLLKLITGVVTPTSGRAIVRGRVSAILELGSGFNGDMSGLENIYLNNTINGIPASETKKRVQQIIDFAELGDFIRQPLKTYSSGMKARLSFAVAINVEPDILIVDEALSVGDAAFQRKCFAKMEQIREAGATILFVSHSESSIVSLCNRAIWISNGEQIIDGDPKLVTGLYMKHANKKKVEKNIVNNEYQQLEKNKKKYEDKKESVKNTIEDSIEEYFDPKLTPKSTIYYDERGAKISDIKVTTLAGMQVNVLTQGKEYIYSYQVTPEYKLGNVQLGFLIKTINGAQLGGCAYPSKEKYIESLNNKVIVKFHFMCNLNDGQYFFNAGLLAQIDEKHDYAHRVLDAYMIKVVSEKKQTTGSVNFVKSIEIKAVI